jgi:hypothetical protein
MSKEGVRPDLKKLQVIRDWKRLVTIKGIKSFLSLANFHWKFINMISIGGETTFEGYFKRSYLLNGKKSNKGHLRI